jgi:hypothetical protein
MNSNLSIYEEKYQEKIKEILKNTPVGRSSFFQMKYFILGKEQTHQARLWRCVQEVNTKSEEIDFIKLELEELADKLALLDLETKKMRVNPGVPDPEGLYKEELEIFHRQRSRKKTSLIKSQSKLTRKLEELKEEAIFYAEAFTSLNNLEPIKPFDDFQSQTEYWSEKLSQELDLKTIFHKAPDLELIKTIMALPDESEIRAKVVNIISADKLKLEQ